MHFPSLLFAATACMRLAYADFIVATEPPIPTTLIPTFSNTDDSQSWTTSVFLNGIRSFAAFTRGLGSDYQAALTSVQSEVKEFAATASNYSIPAGVTDAATTTTIVGKPDWYDALPSGVRSFKEQEWGYIKSFAAQVIADDTQAAQGNVAKSTGGAPALPTGSLGLMNAGWAVGAAAAAAFL